MVTQSVIQKNKLYNVLYIMYTCPSIENYFCHPKLKSCIHFEAEKDSQTLYDVITES